MAVLKNVAFYIVFSLTNRHGAFLAQQRLFAYKPRCSALSALSQVSPGAQLSGHHQRDTGRAGSLRQGLNERTPPAP
jgi:hypothetical protein